jgi:hypothetical protein
VFNVMEPPLPWSLLAAPLVLVAPGYALARGARLGGPGDTLTLGVCAIALSCAALSLGGLALTGLGVPLTTGSWSALLMATTLAGSVLALRGHRRFAKPHAALWATARRSGPASLLLTAALALVVAAAIEARSSEKSLDAATARPHLSAVRIGDRAAISVSNATAVQRSYRISVATGRRSFTWRVILHPKATWRKTIRLDETDDQSSSVTLYRAGSSSPSLYTVMR